MSELTSGTAAGRPAVLVRVYRGREQPDAVALYRADATELAALDYLPVSQSWAEGQWSDTQVVLAVILLLFIIGFFLVAYMLITRPDGSLAVTYVLRDAR